MLQRKIYKRIEAFYKDRPNKAMMITGARQVGKSFIVEEFCKSHYDSFIRIDFITNPEYISALAGTGSTQEILLRLSALFGDQMIPGKTIIFFDEVQECRELLTHIKYLVQEGSYDSFLLLKNPEIALPVNVVDEPKVPLLLSKSKNLFKLFSNDVGLLAAQYGGGIQIRILQHKTTINFGSIYENVAAEELTAHGFTLYYYNSKKFGELDYVIEADGKVLPIEIKSGKDYYRHNAMDNVLKQSDYGIEEGYVFCGGNIEHTDKITYFPIYMIMFLQKKELPESLIYTLDLSGLQ